jgi:hypothetical protein
MRIEKFITGVVNNHGSKMYSIYANPEHMHFLVSRSPLISEEDFAAIVADASEKFINENSLCNRKFKWQNTGSAFSAPKSHIKDVCKYILNQPVHHRKFSFEEEYNAFIKHYQHTLKWERG